MKFLKFAVLCAASFAAMATAARADELSDLKAELQALTARVAELSAEPNVPAGYKLLTMSKADAIIVPGFEVDANYAPVAHNIGIRPTADMPEASNLQWSGFVRAALVHTDVENDARTGAGAIIPVANPGSALHLVSRGELKVSATNDTAVGEVGVTTKLRTDFDGANATDVTMPEAWGWWKLTNELTFGAGFTGSLGTVGHGGDNLTAMYSGGVDAGGGNDDTTQFRLGYASGPISAAVALIHQDEGADEDFGVEGEVKFESDLFSAEVAGWMIEDLWVASVGATIEFTDLFKLSASAHMGENGDDIWLGGFAPMLNADSAGSTAFAGASVFAGADFSDSLSAELAYSYRVGEGSNVASTVDFEETRHKVAGGLYYTPVSQVTVGIEGSYYLVNIDNLTSAESVEVVATSADIVTVFRF